MDDFDSPQNICTGMLLDIPRIRALLDEELSMFDIDLKSDRDRSYSDMRGALISWFATFLPDVFTKTYFKRLTSYCNELAGDVDFVESVSHRLFHLNAAVAAFGNAGVIQQNIRGIDHEVENVRRAALESLCFIRPMLSYSRWFGRDVLNRVVHNIELARTLARESLLLYIVSDESELMQESLSEVVELIGDAGDAGCWDLNYGMLKTGRASNSFFHTYAENVERYVLVRLAGFIATPLDMQWELFPDQTFPKPVPDIRFEQSAGEMWSKLSYHPLLREQVTFSEE